MYSYESPAYSEFCKKVHGMDLKQMGMVTMYELEIFLKEIQLPPGSKILDLGCNAGYLAGYISKRYSSHVTGIDISKNSIDYAKKTFTDNQNLDFKEMDFNELKFEPSSFDLIYSFDTLYFTRTAEKLRNLLDKCKDILKPGGKLAVFWSAFPSSYNPEFAFTAEPCAENTPLGIWAELNKVKYQAFDFTAYEREFYPRALKELRNLRHRLEAEVPEMYKILEGEFSTNADLSVKGDAGGVYRWLYVFNIVN